MRTTINLDDDIAQTAKTLAERYSKTLGEVISELARKGLTKINSSTQVRNGIPLFRTTSNSTNPLGIDSINELRDSE